MQPTTSSQIPNPNSFGAVSLPKVRLPRNTLIPHQNTTMTFPKVNTTSFDSQLETGEILGSLLDQILSDGASESENDACHQHLLKRPPQLGRIDSGVSTGSSPVPFNANAATNAFDGAILNKSLDSSFESLTVTQQPGVIPHSPLLPPPPSSSSLPPQFHTGHFTSLQTHLPPYTMQTALMQQPAYLPASHSLDSFPISPLAGNLVESQGKGLDKRPTGNIKSNADVDIDFDNIRISFPNRDRLRRTSSMSDTPLSPTATKPGPLSTGLHSLPPSPLSPGRPHYSALSKNIHNHHSHQPVPHHPILSSAQTRHSPLRNSIPSVPPPPRATAAEQPQEFMQSEFEENIGALLEDSFQEWDRQPGSASRMRKAVSSSVTAEEEMTLMYAFDEELQQQESFVSKRVSGSRSTATGLLDVDTDCDKEDTPSPALGVTELSTSVSRDTSDAILHTYSTHPNLASINLRRNSLSNGGSLPSSYVNSTSNAGNNIGNSTIGNTYPSPEPWSVSIPTASSHPRAQNPYAHSQQPPPSYGTGYGESYTSDSSSFVGSFDQFRPSHLNKPGCSTIVPPVAALAAAADSSANGNNVVMVENVPVKVIERSLVFGEGEDGNGYMTIPDRKWKHSVREQYDLRHFTVMTYNVLAPYYATQTKYSDTDPECLTWESRRARVLDEIIFYAPDFVCLQEVSPTDFRHFFLPKMRKFGYDGHFQSKKRGHVADGCAVFYLYTRFSLIALEAFAYNDQVKGMTADNANADIATRLNPFCNVALVCVFQNNHSRTTHQKFIRVVNTHLHWDPVYADTKLLQTSILLEWLSKTYSDVPTIIAADLNSQPGEPVMELLLKGKVETKHFGGRDFGKYSSDEHLTSPFRFTSAYAKGDVPFTNKTTDFTGIIDHLLYTSDALSLKDVLVGLRSDVRPPSPFDKRKGSVCSMSGVFGAMDGVDGESKEEGAREGHDDEEAVESCENVAASSSLENHGDENENENENVENATAPEPNSSAVPSLTTTAAATTKIETEDFYDYLHHVQSFPNSVFPSDHICLIGCFKWKARPRGVYGASLSSSLKQKENMMSGGMMMSSSVETSHHSGSYPKSGSFGKGNGFPHNRYHNHNHNHGHGSYHGHGYGSMKGKPKLGSSFSGNGNGSANGGSSSLSSSPGFARQGTMRS